MDVDAALCGLRREATAIDSEPAVGSAATHGVLCHAVDGSGIVVDVQHEVADICLCRAICHEVFAQFEVGAAGADGHGIAGIVKHDVGTQVEHGIVAGLQPMAGELPNTEIQVSVSIVLETIDPTSLMRINCQPSAGEMNIEET